MKIFKDKKFKSHLHIYDIFNESLESYYWLGFLLADGHFTSSGGLNLELSIRDLNHLEKFKLFTKSKNKITHRKAVCSLNNKNKLHDLVCFRIYDTINIKVLANKYKITNRKTYEPPEIDIENLENDKFLSLFIGFVDGDGCLAHYRGKYPKIVIGIHKSWFNILKEFQRNFQNIFNIEFPEKTCKIDKRGAALLSIGKLEILKYLKKFLIEHNLPALERKWCIISHE